MQGRDQECRLLRGMVAELLIYQKESGIIVLIGGRGSGKGVLVKELQKFGTEAGLFVIKTASAEDEKKNRRQSQAVAPAGRGSTEPGVHRGSITAARQRTSAYIPVAGEAAGGVARTTREEVEEPPPDFEVWREVVEQVGPPPLHPADLRGAPRPSTPALRRWWCTR